MAQLAQQLTHHVKSGVRCSVNVTGGTRCTNQTWELCDKCDQPACGRHTVAHYRLHHPRML